MTASHDSIDQLEHDHLVVEKIIEDLRDAIQHVLREERDAEALKPTFEEFLGIADDELYEHFDREEQVLFPFLVEHLPDCESAIQQLEFGHDRMCGALSRMGRIIEDNDAAFETDFDALVMLFTRFEANFAKHATEERELLHTLGLRLEDDELRTLTTMLSEI